MTPHAQLFARALEHAVRFRDELPDRPPWPEVGARELLDAFDAGTPEFGEDPVKVLDALAQAAEPGLGAPAGPRFFGWVMGASHPVGVAADILTSAWGQNAGNYASAPAAAMAEKAAARWLLDILRLPSVCSVGFVTGATMANFTCLAAARHAVLAAVGWDVESRGLAGGPPVRVFVGDEAHATVLSALRYLGLGAPVLIPSDAEGCMDHKALRAALELGSGPAIVVAQAGQINTGAFDVLPAIAAICRDQDAWLHVDGAFGLWARASREFDHLTLGLDEADSWAVDGHKWLQLPYDSGFAIVRDPKAHQQAMRIAASYLPTPDGLERDPAQFTPELSRRARGFAAWAVLRTLGRHGIASMVRRHGRLARALAARLRAEPGVDVLNEVALNQVIVAFGDGPLKRRDALTRAVIARMRVDNVCLAGGAQWKGQWVLRLPILAAPLSEPDIHRLAEAILSAWAHVQAASALGQEKVIHLSDLRQVSAVRG